MLTKTHRSDSDVTDTPEAAAVLADLRQRGLTHKWVTSRRSSQAFAINLFAALGPDAVGEILGRTVARGLEVCEAGAVQFEWQDPDDALAESARPRPHRTQVDVRLDGQTRDGRRVTALVEVKLSETDFGHCSARESEKNPARDVCATPGPFGDAPDRCFQLANHGHGRRAYDRYLPAFSDSPPRTAGCWFAASASQPMRNIALAGALVSTDRADIAGYVLCAPTGHDSIWRRHREVAQMFADDGNVHIASISAETIALLNTDGGMALASRYPAPVLCWSTAGVPLSTQSVDGAL